jgi:hypothetical protein
MRSTRRAAPSASVTYDEPQCIVVCPVECIFVDPAHIETPEQLLAKGERLKAEEAA